MVKSAQILLLLIRVFSHPKGAEALYQVTDTQVSLMTERIFFSWKGDSPKKLKDTIVTLFKPSLGPEVKDFDGGWS